MTYSLKSSGNQDYLYTLVLQLTLYLKLKNYNRKLVKQSAFFKYFSIFFGIYSFGRGVPTGPSSYAQPTDGANR